MSGGQRVLRTWVLGRLAVPWLAGAALLFATGGSLDALVDHPASHQIAKVGVECWHNVLSRLDRLPWFAAGALCAGAVLPWLRPRWWVVGAVLAALPMLLLAPYGTAALWITTALLLVLLAPLSAVERLGAATRWIAAVPGSWLVAPLATLHGAGWPPRRPWGRVVGALGAVVLGACGLGLDIGLDSGVYDRRLDPIDKFPARLLDDRIEIVALAGPDLHCEYHDIDLVDGHAIVLTELTGLLMAFPPDGSDPVVHQLPKHWGPKLGTTLDSETDPSRGLTWLLEGPDHVAAYRLLEDRWERQALSRPLPRPMDHTYTALLPDEDLLLLYHINSKSDPTRSFLELLDLPAMQQPRLFEPVDAGGEPLPSPRDIAWIPPLKRVAVSPDFGTALYLVNPFTGGGERWIEVPTLNGKLTWVPEIGRLLVPLPQARELWVVEPVSGAVESRVPVQLGVRTAALDARRGLLVTASVFTGQIQVRRWPDGQVISTMGRVMPMVREVVLDADRGVGWLTTWEALYRFPYADE